MQRNRKRLLVLIAALIAGGLIYLTLSLIPAVFPEKRTLLPLKEKAITRLTITGNGKTQTLIRKNNAWSVEINGKGYRGNPEMISSLTASLLQISKDTIVSNNLTKHEGFGIGKDKITVFAGNKEYTLYTGNMDSEDSLYLRYGKENEVFTARGFASPALQDYRNLRPSLIRDEKKIDGIRIEKSTGITILEKKGTQWFAGAKKAKASSVQTYISDIAGLTGSDIMEAAPGGLPARPFLTVDVTDKNKTASVRFFEQDKTTSVMKPEQSAYYYLIPQVYAASLLKEERDFLE